MGDRRNILHGITQVQVDGADVGYTEGGVEIEKTLDTFEKEVDQELDATDICPTKYSMIVRTSFAEITLANIKRVWNENASIVTVPGVSDTLALGYQQTIPEHQLKFIGTAPSGFSRTYTLWRAKQISSSAHSLQKGEKAVIPVEFRCLPDFDKSTDERYGQIVDLLA